MPLDRLGVSFKMVFVVRGASSFVGILGCDVKKDFKGLLDELIITEEKVE